MSALICYLARATNKHELSQGKTLGELDKFIAYFPPWEMQSSECLLDCIYFRNLLNDAPIFFFFYSVWEECSVVQQKMTPTEHFE